MKIKALFTSLFLVSLVWTSASAAPAVKTAPPVKTETAVLAGGCFWGVEELLRTQPGVVDVEVGYTGGKLDNPIYNIVKTGASGHAEAVQVIFDPKKTSYEKILLYFFKIHDPTTANRQGNDVGTQYRSSIFFQNEAQHTIAEKVKSRVEKSKAWKKPIVTEIVEFKKWYKAEGDHQDYLQKNPGGYTCHFPRDIEF
ncbi:MAG: peptide-methionine (S)-S-oxide reductase MsrA [Bdellovibrionota bacterium]